VKVFGSGSVYLQIESSDTCTIPILNASCWENYRDDTLMYRFCLENVDATNRGRGKHTTTGTC